MGYSNYANVDVLYIMNDKKTSKKLQSSQKNLRPLFEEVYMKRKTAFY
jgi:hypothetical protein